MNEQDMVDTIQEALVGADTVKSTKTFADSGVLTTDRGLVVKMEDGSEFQITVVQSKRANGDEDEGTDDEDEDG